MTPLLQVSIGRNVGDVPMTDARWWEFTSDVSLAMAETVGAPDFTVVGDGGRWNDTAEESAVLTVLNPRPAGTEALTGLLRELAEAYEQDAIALTMGASVLVERQPVAVAS